MPKQIYCAKCGTELLMQLKAIPSEGRVISVVEPHSCDEKAIKTYERIYRNSCKKGKEFKHVGTVSGRITSKSNVTEEARAKCVEAIDLVDVTAKTGEESVKEHLTKKAKVAALFDEFPFVKKLNKEAKEHEVPEAPGDKRDKKHLREELQTSSAPLSILSRIPTEAGKTIPEHEMEEPEDENA